MNKAKNLILVIALFSCSAMAQNIDVGTAATGALVTVLIRGAIAFCLFKLITLNLTRKSIDTPTKTGRWVGAWLMGASILTNPSFNKSDLDFYIGSVVLAIVWFVIGFAVGFMWRKFKPSNSVVSQQKKPEMDDEKLWEQASAELNSSNKNEGLWAKCYAESGGDEAKAKAQYLSARVSKLKLEDIKPDEVIADKPDTSNVSFSNYWIYGLVVIIVFGALFLFKSNTSFTAKQTKDITYNVFGCKDGESESENCDRVIKSKGKLIPNKNTQEVVLEFTDVKTQKLNKQIRTNCNVIDDKNWSCVYPASKPSSSGGQQLVYTGGDIEMKNGLVSVTGLTINIYNNGRFTSKIYIPSPKYVAQE